MDAGLAAILGALVGAIGTGGAGIIVALIARSQSRLQLEVETARGLREPRKSIFVAYSEGCREQYEELQSALSSFQDVAAPEATPEEQGTAIGEVERHLKAALNQSAARAHLHAQVVIEGPERVIDAAIDLSDRLHAFENAVIQALSKPALGEDRFSDELDDALTKEAEAGVAYRLFLYTASDSLTVDGVDNR
ncbi:hypothetical protein J7E87_10975 [Streptomyces sp. ISL-1]|uniref:hypothetical protein n=1 Tax=Streptomyces sp. ISL-1 TaxID=2817657 RepID=UPI001BEB26BE|nr:hypothetical protein [Streptomyces sp. ISL-1]MBT2389930.1 hypothetical protein [Streptomyces sp. ISL-1]